VPVYLDENGDVRTTEAVVDKDMASSLLATRIGADEFISLRMCHIFYINYRKPDQEIKEFLNYADALKYLQEVSLQRGVWPLKLRHALILLSQVERKVS